MPADSQEKTSQRLKRLGQRLAQAQLARTFFAWKEEAEFERSVHRLDTLLYGCQDVFDQPPHQRSEACIAAVQQLLQQMPLLAVLCPSAQRCIAEHAKLVVLSDLLELPSCPDDACQLYAVLHGAVTLLHGDCGDPRLQKLLQAAQQQQAVQQQQLLLSAGQATASGNEGGSLASCDSSSSAFGRSCNGPGHNRQGIWCRVAEAVNAGQKRQLDSMGGQQANNSNTVQSASTTGRDSTAAHESPGPAAVPKGTPQGQITGAGSSSDGSAAELLGVQWDAALARLSLGIVGAGQCFCGCKFAQGWSSGTSSAAATSPDGHGGEELGLHNVTLPCSCLAAVAEPNRVVGLLVISRPVYMEAARINFECHVARLVDLLCRLPSLRHTPVKELHKLAAHMKEATYEPGQVLLKQGKEVSEIHCLTSGSLLLTYAPPTNTAAAAAARASLGGAISPPLCNNNDSMPGVHSAATAAAVAASAGADASAAGASSAAAAAIIAAVAAGGVSANGAGLAAAAGMKRTSGLADLLRLGQQTIQPAAVVGMRGPGCILGDDVLRERHLAVGVVAASKVYTLRVEPQKFLLCLDPLTLRLFGRLRPQQQPAQQKLIQDVLEEPGTQLQPQPEYVHRTAVLSDVYESEQLPITLLRPGDEGHELNLTQSRSSAGGKPEWRVPRVRDPISTTAKVSASHARHRSPTSPEPGAASSEPLLDGLSHAGQSSVNAGVWRHSTHHHRSAGSSNGLNPEDEAWEAALPRGLTIDKCVGLPQSSSVLQLLEVIRDVDEFRRMQGSLLLPSSDTVSMNFALSSITSPATGTAAAAATAGRTSAADWCPPLTGLRIAGASGTAAAFACANSSTSTLSKDPAALAAAAAAAAAGSNAGSSVHTELVEACGIAVLQLSVLPGQAAVPGSTLASALDDVASSWAAAAHDEGLQLIRWGAKRWMLLAQLEPGSSKRAGLEGLADVLLSAAARMAGVLSRAEGLPALSLAAGMASGSCFVQSEAGNFVASISGHAYDAAAELCNAAAAMGAAGAAEYMHSSSGGGSRITLLISDGAACCLQTIFCLVPSSGGFLLTSARSALPPGPSGIGKLGLGFSSAFSRQTLGPGRHTMLGTGALLAAGCMTPKTPGQGLVLRRGSGKAQQRRQMRRKFEALQDLLAGAMDALPPPPDYMLTQPPLSAAISKTAATGSDSTTSSNRSGAAGSSRGVNFGANTDGNATGRSPVGRPFKPNLKIAVTAERGSGSDLAPSSTPTPAQNLSSCKTPTQKAPQLDCYSSGALTPTLIMDSPRTFGQTGQTGELTGTLRQQQASRQSLVWSKTSQQSPAARAAVASARSPVPGQLCAEGSAKSNTSGATPSSTNSRTSLRQQVWQEVGEMRGRRGADESVPVGLLAAASAAAATCGTDAAVPGCRRVGLKLDLQAAPACTAAAATAGDVAGFAKDSESLQLHQPGTAGACAAGSIAARSGVKSALKVTFQSPGNRLSSINGAISHSGSRASAIQPQVLHHAAVLPKQQQQQYQRHQHQQHEQEQEMEQEPSLQSVNSLSLFPDPCRQSEDKTTLHHSSTGKLVGAASRSTTSPAAAAGRAAEAARLQQQRQQALVVSACKALGSFAAAEGYVAALPEGLMTVNLSAAGLSRLPSLSRLTQLESLAASFNRLSSLPPLVPADEAALAAAVAAARDTGDNSSSSTDALQAKTNAAPIPAGVAVAASAVAEQLSKQLPSNVVSPLPFSLMRLGLAYNQLEVVPVELPAALPYLTALDLSHNKLKELPITLGGLSCLKVLFLAHNQLAHLPPSFTRLFLLQTLDVNHNSLAQLPANLDQLQSLSSLQAQHNRLVQVPRKLSAIQGLKSLGLGYNDLQQLPAGCLTGLSGLTCLGLAGNGLTDAVLQAAVDVPDAAERAGALLAAAVLPALRLLDLSDNQLQCFPAWVPANLVHLLAANNRICEVPGEQLSQLSSSLVELDLQQNVIQDMPAQLRIMTRLQVLMLGGNPGMDPELLEKGGGLLWAYKWMAAQKSAVLRGTHAQHQQQRAQQGQPLVSLPGIRQTIVGDSGRSERLV